MAETGTCSICEGMYRHMGNSPYPFPSEDGERCCHECDNRFVTPARMFGITSDHKQLLEVLQKFAKQGRILATLMQT